MDHHQLEDLINRLSFVLAMDDKPLMIHWSDIELLKKLQTDMQDQERKIYNISQAFDELFKK